MESEHCAVATLAILEVALVALQHVEAHRQIDGEEFPAEIVEQDVRVVLDHGVFAFDVTARSTCEEKNEVAAFVILFVLIILQGLRASSQHRVEFFDLLGDSVFFVAFWILSAIGCKLGYFLLCDLVSSIVLLLCFNQVA